MYNVECTVYKYGFKTKQEPRARCALKSFFNDFKAIFVHCTLYIIHFSLLAPLLAASPQEQTKPPFTADLSWGDVSLKLTLDSPVIDPARDVVLILTLTTPAGLDATLPDLRDRFRGFSRVEDFAKEPVALGTSTRRETVWRLTPEVAKDYVLRPFAVTLTDTRSNQQSAISNQQFSSFATRPITFPAAPLPEFVEGEIQADLKPLYIPPSPRTIAIWSLLALLGIGLLILLIWGLRHLRRVVREHRMSPRERAFAELDRLLHRGYIEKGLYKDFYIELTHVVRRYIERTHGIHAPAQTTEEFLREASRHPRFTGDVLQRLKDFLESADLIKFAGVTATPDLASSSTDAARRYIDADSVSSLSQQA